jgi:hypothetical protein
MAIKVALQNPFSSEIRLVKVGWSWTLFFFSTFGGIILFRRKLVAWGSVFLAINALAFVGGVSGSPAIGLLVGVLQIILPIIMGAKGNELTARALLGRGWRFVEPDSETTRYGKMRWRIFDQPPTILPKDQTTNKVAGL